MWSASQIMKRCLKRITLFTALFLISISAAVAKDLPYKGRAEGEIIQPPQIIGDMTPGTGPFLREKAVATGNFTQVGDAAIELEWELSMEIEEGKLVFLLVGTFIITAADNSTMSGSFCSFQALGSLTNQIEVRVFEGTGRFEGVTGIIPGIGIRTGNTFSYELAGMIQVKEGK